MRTLLVPERQRLGDLRILVDAGLDLERTIDDTILAELDDRHTVGTADVRTDCHERHKVVLTDRCKWRDQREHRLRRPRQSEKDVVGLDSGIRSQVAFLCHRPLVFLSIEHAGVRHVVLREYIALQGTQPGWIPIVVLDERGSVIERLEQPRVDAVDGSRNGIGFVNEVEGRRSIECVHGVHETVANVVDSLAVQFCTGIVVLAIGKVLRRRISLAKPEELALGVRDDVGITVHLEEWRDVLDAFLEIAVDHDA